MNYPDGFFESDLYEEEIRELDAFKEEVQYYLKLMIRALYQDYNEDEFEKIFEDLLTNFDLSLPEESPIICSKNLSSSLFDNIVKTNKKLFG